MDPQKILETINQLQNKYEEDVKKFHHFSPISEIDVKPIHINLNLDSKDVEIKDEKVNNSIKQLLKIIHPDKIKMIFGSEHSQEELDKLLECSTKIIQNDINFIESLKLIKEKTIFFDIICKKLNLTKDQIDKIIQINYEENIDSYFDPEFIDLVKKYNEIKSKTIYNYIYIKINALFSNWRSDLTALLENISSKIKIFTNYDLTKEQRLMASEEFSLESQLFNKNINLHDLSKIYPNSEFTKTTNLIIETFPELNKMFTSYEIKIERHMSLYFNFINTFGLLKPCTKYLYEKYKKNI